MFLTSTYVLQKMDYQKNRISKKMEYQKMEYQKKQNDIKIKYQKMEY